MARKYIYLALSLSLTLISCKEELQPQEDSTAVRADQNPTNTTQKTAATSNTAQNPAQTAAAITTNKTSQQQSPLNPAHGQPGHVCGIAVGAPLNSKPTQAPTPGNKTITTQNIQASPQVTTTPTKTAPGMNPPHGQPGHVCGIAVGAPLNSKPTKAPTSATTTNAYSVTPTNKPAGTPSLLSPPATTSAPAVETAPGMNPPHGQPGHVCGIAVGAPLNSEKKEEKKTE